MMKNLIVYLIVVLCPSSLIFAQDIQTYDPAKTIIIPVIVHVVYGKGSQNIDLNLIKTELEELNKDFQMQNADFGKTDARFKPLAANANIKFVLADTVFNAAWGKGVNRVRRGLHYKLHHADKIIFPKRYLNIYIGNTSIDGFTYDDKLWERPELDAVFVNYTLVGGNHRIFTHEIGHWCGLYHTFEDGCEKDGDEVADTPPQKYQTGFKYKLGDIQENYCDETNLPNYNNFMDYSNYRYMFTVGQVIKIRDCIFNFRKRIYFGK